MTRTRLAAALLALTITAAALTSCTLPDAPATDDKPAAADTTKPADKPAASSEEKPADDQTSEKPADDPKVTKSQAAALAAAELYLSTAPFSEKGLIDQLVFDKFSEEDATYAAKHCGADWNEQAVKAAKNYLGVMPMSEDALVDQLKFDGFTDAQAKHGAAEAFKD